MTLFMKGDKIQFGRKNGEQTLGMVEKVNGKSLKVRTLESRGRDGRSVPGMVWRVHPSLATLVERNGKPATNADRFPNTSVKPSGMLTGDDLILHQAMAKLTAIELRVLTAHLRRGYIDASRF
jgi:hypothetical protein